MGVDDLSRRGKTVHDRHLHVNQQHVRIIFFILPYRGFAIIGRPCNIGRACRFENRGQRRAYNWIIIDDCDSHHTFSFVVADAAASSSVLGMDMNTRHPS